MREKRGRKTDAGLMEEINEDLEQYFEMNKHLVEGANTNAKNMIKLNIKDIDKGKHSKI